MCESVRGPDTEVLLTSLRGTLAALTSFLPLPGCLVLGLPRPVATQRALAFQELQAHMEGLGAKGLRWLEGQAAWGPSLGTDLPCPEPRGGGGSEEAPWGVGVSVSEEMSHWPPAGLLNTARPWDARSPPNDSEDTPGIHSRAQLHSLPLTVTHSHTGERALLKHTPPKTLKQRQGTHPGSYRHTAARTALPDRLRQDNTRTSPHSHSHSDTLTGDSLSGFTLSTTEKISVSALWLRGREKKKWK